jgi:DNA ligase D-like protein (predicted 3'-phosphoesterase)
MGTTTASTARKALSRYHGKRDFSRTPEPKEGGRAGQGVLSFVIQKHHASHLHYDFRLELDGTFKSWAVPKGPCLDPTVKRMAVHVEDHPISYADFEGTIPPKQYGAGTVIVWDRGDWLPEGGSEGDARKALAAGKLKFELRGEKLKGHWTLVRMRGKGDEKHEPWLLIKERDDAARDLADYDVLEDQPASVLTGRGVDEVDSPPKKAAPAKKAAAKKPEKKVAKKEVKKEVKKKTALPATFQPQLATLAAFASVIARRLALRTQVRRLPPARPHRQGQGALLHPQRPRLDRQAARHRQGARQAAHRFGLARRRDHRGRGERRARLPGAAERLRPRRHFIHRLLAVRCALSRRAGPARRAGRGAACAPGPPARQAAAGAAAPERGLRCVAARPAGVVRAHRLRGHRRQAEGLAAMCRAARPTGSSSRTSSARSS